MMFTVQFKLVQKVEGKVRENMTSVIEFAFSDPWKRPSRQWDSPLEKGNASQKGGSSKYKIAKMVEVENISSLILKEILPKMLLN